LPQLTTLTTVSGRSSRQHRPLYSTGANDSLAASTVSFSWRPSRSC